MTFDIKGYWTPTPVKIRKIADSILAGVIFAGSMTALNGLPVLGTCIFVIGFLAKIVSNFFTEEPINTVNNVS